MVGVKSSGIKEVKDLLSMVEARAVRGTPFFARAETMMFRDTLRHFDQETGPSGAWAPWAPATKKARARGRGGNKILQDTGDLRNKPQLSHAKDNAELTWNLKYAAVHDNGGKNVPARPYAYLSDRAIVEIADDYLEFVVTGKTP